MGFFSWRCAECGESISNIYSSRPEESDCVLITPNKTYHDPAYDGYGRFAGVDVYELLGDGDRDKAIKAQFNGNPDELPFKIKVLHKRCHSPDKTYADYAESERCEAQGFFYEEDI